MKASNRDLLLFVVLKAMRNENDYQKRYDLWALGESLLVEYKDLKKEVVRDKIAKIIGEPVPVK